MKRVDTIARVRRAFYVQRWSVKKIVRELHVSRNTVRKILRSDETDFSYERTHQPMPRIGPWQEQLDRFLGANVGKPSRERLTLIRIFEELRALGYEGYRPFDKRFTYFSKDVVDWPREKIMIHFLRGENLSLLFPRQLASAPYHHIFATNCIAEMCAISNKTKEQNAVFPLYLYPSEQDLDQTRRVNFDPKLYKRLQTLAKHPTHGTPDEVAVFDYIYGVLHCPAYRATYAEFLKIDFPRIPSPATPDEFWDISVKGTTLRKLHLMDPATIGPAPYPFKGEGDAVVDKPRFEDGKVWINQSQYFDAAPAVSWGFYIGGYQPAQKWLKDRKGRALSFDDVKHYQRILKILSETDRIVQTITMTLKAAEAAP